MFFLVFFCLFIGRMPAYERLCREFALGFSIHGNQGFREKSREPFLHSETGKEWLCERGCVVKVSSRSEEKIKFFTEKNDRVIIKMVVDLYFGGAKCIIHMLWGLII